MTAHSKISVALIVRDEAQVLARCLTKVRDYVDEIIVVDTGSTDDTKSIARQFTDRIFDFAWCDDFSKARQYAFDQATGDWLFWIDADEILEGVEHLRAELEALPATTSSVLWKNIVVKNGNADLNYWRERCIRNDGSFRWVGRVHENLIRSQEDQKIYSERIFIEHHQIHQPLRTRRNLNILEAEFEELGDDVSSRTLFYLGNEYMDYAEWEKAVEVYRLYLKKGTWLDERYFAAVRLGRSLRNLVRYDEAIDAYLSALKEHPEFPHAYFGLAEIYYFQQAWRRVIYWAEVGEQSAAPDTILFLRAEDWEYDWIIHYTNALYRVGRLQDALEWTNYALTLHPDDEQHLTNQRFFLGCIDVAILSQLNLIPD